MPFRPLSLDFGAMVAIVYCGMAGLVWANPVPPAASTHQKAPAAKPPRETRLLCNVVYQPAGSAWLREVVLVDSGKALQAIRIDGVPVYTFMRQGPVIRTALDNERIELDLARPGWTSDFRGLAQGMGHCVVEG